MNGKTDLEEELETYDINTSPFLELQTPFTRRCADVLFALTSLVCKLDGRHSSHNFCFKKASLAYQQHYSTTFCPASLKDSLLQHRELTKMVLLVWLVPLRLAIALLAMLVLAILSFALAYKQ